MNSATRDILISLANRLDSLGHGRKSAEVEAVAEQLGWSKNRVYSNLKSLGWTSGRKLRCDAGRTSQDEDVLTELAATFSASTRANGKVIMDVPNARSMLSQNGRQFKVSNNTLGRLLSKRAMNSKALKRDTAHTDMKSLHPNHVHQVDPSYCILYYLPNNSGQAIQRWASEDEFYKNKPQNIEKQAAFRVWRYVLTDHYSSSIVVRYFQSAGETQKNLYEFLLYAWQQLEGRPFHGVPSMLVWDKGSANTSGAIKNALKALEVSTYDHKAKNARAKGQVEGANNLVEKLFESRLTFEPVSSVDELNAAAESWCKAYNANAIPDYDSRLQRPGMAVPQARYALWQTIRQEQLRLLPDLDVCKALLTAEPKTRKVSQGLTISFAHPMAKKSLTYDLRDLPNVFPGATVMVSWMVYGDHLVNVTVDDYRGESSSHIVEPVQFDDFTGFRVDAPVWGQEFESKPDSLVDANKKAADRVAYPDLNSEEERDKAKKKRVTPFGGLDAHSHLDGVYVPEFMNRKGTQINLPDTNTIEAKPMSHIEACKQIVAVIGRPLTSDENQLVRSTHPDGVLEQDFDSLVALITEPTAPTRTHLSIV
ncbi:MAG: integrase [Pseudohongiella sp.]|nr:MAG: integrase [Pseudohongiella sp.]